MVIFLVIVIGLSGVRFGLLLYIQFTASFLIGRERTVNFQNQHLGSHLATDYTIIQYSCHTHGHG